MGVVRQAGIGIARKSRIMHSCGGQLRSTCRGLDNAGVVREVVARVTLGDLIAMIHCKRLLLSFSPSFYAER